MLAFNLAPLFTFGEVLRRLAAILRIDGEELARIRPPRARDLDPGLVRVSRGPARGPADRGRGRRRRRLGHHAARAPRADDLPAARSVGRVVVFAVALLLTFNVFIDIGPILAGAGILGLAVSFGAQSLVKDVISGFFILFENQFAIGDVIEVAGKSGVVEKMTLRVVVLRDGEGIMHVVPNSEIKVVSNKTRGWSRAVVDVGVPYDENVDRALEVLRDEAAQFSTDKPGAPSSTAPSRSSGVESLSDSAVVLRTMIRTQPGSQWTVAREFRRRIKNRFDQEKLEIPFPQRRVHVRVEGGPAGIDPGRPAPRPGRRADEPSPLQHAHPPDRAVRSPPAGQGHALHLRAHRLQLRPHRQLPDVPVRGPPAPLARGERVRGLPRHEPHRRGRQDDRRRRGGRPAAPRIRPAVHRRVSRGPATTSGSRTPRSIPGRRTTSRR